MGPSSYRMKENGRSRGVALLIALTMVVALTIFLLALSFEFGSAQKSQHANLAEAQVDNLARAGFDFGFSMLNRSSTPLTKAQTQTIELNGARCQVSAAPADDNDAIYGGNFIRKRPGDVILAIQIQAKGTSAENLWSYRYLVNTNPAHPRRLFYETSNSKAGRP